MSFRFICAILVAEKYPKLSFRFLLANVAPGVCEELNVTIAIVGSKIPERFKGIFKDFFFFFFLII
jgi:hypothetical protein